MEMVSVVVKVLLNNYQLILILLTVVGLILKLINTRWNKKINKLELQPQLSLKELGLIDLTPCRNNRNVGYIEAWVNLINIGGIATKLDIKGNNGLATHMDATSPTIAKKETPLVVRIRIEKASQNKEYPLLIFYKDKLGGHWKQTIIFQKTNEQDKDRFKPRFLEPKVDHFRKIRFLIHKIKDLMS